MLQDEDIQALTSIGLTVLQAKVYLTLVKLGKATIKAISKTAEIARQDIYRVTSELHKLGLVEKVIAAPNEFKAIPLTEGIHILLQRMHEERAESHKKIVQLMRRHKDENVKINPQEPEPQFLLVPEKEVRRRLRIAIENAQTSIDTIVTWGRLRIGMFDFDEIIKKALKRGVKFRFIIDKPEDENPLLEIREAFKKNPLYKVKYSNHNLSAVLGIYDEKEVIISISATGGIGEAPVLATNNPCLLALAKNYFEVMWRTTLEPKPERPWQPVSTSCS